ncbi:protein PERCC1 [Tachysurus ichikawai]
MAASVIRPVSGFGPSPTAQTYFISADEDELEDEYEDELRDEVEDSFEEEEDDSTGVESQVTDPQVSDLYSEIATDRLLRFAELISSDVQRYFGRSQDSDTCDIYTGRSRHEITVRQLYYSNILKAASSEPGDEPKNLGPLAELFQSAQVKKQGLPMIQRRLPSSFWTEPRPEHLCVTANVPDMVTCSTETMNPNSSMPVINMSSSTTPDFSDLLEHWASDKETCSAYSCEYQLP